MQNGSERDLVALRIAKPITDKAIPPAKSRYLMPSGTIASRSGGNQTAATAKPTTPIAGMKKIHRHPRCRMPSCHVGCHQVTSSWGSALNSPMAACISGGRRRSIGRSSWVGDSTKGLEMGRGGRSTKAVPNGTWMATAKKNPGTTKHFAPERQFTSGNGH